jgi:amino-acid N-acetyltransferase
VLRAREAGDRGRLLRMSVSAAQAADLPAIRALLAANGLPAADLTPAHLGSFWVLRDPAGLAGVVGLEPRGRAALFRSLAVRADLRGRGVGAALLAHAESQAGALGVDAVYLLTTTAQNFFAARGYEVMARGAAPPDIRATAEFAGLCPSTSICMTKRVAP